MKVKPILPLLVFVIGLLASTLTPGPARARAQQRGPDVARDTSSVSGSYYALVIGNDDHVSLPKLRTAAADARAVERVLSVEYGFQTRLLINATRARIISALSAYRRELGAEASLLIYYAGHGYREGEADKTFWLPVDATLEDTSNWIIADEISTSIRVIRARHVLVVSDSCYSGTLTRGADAAPSRPSEREQFLQKMAAGRSRTLMASGGDQPVADGGGSGHSVFAAALLRGLRQTERPRFTSAELFSYVVQAVAGRANQTPEHHRLLDSGHEAGDFVFVRVKPGDKSTGMTAGVPASPTPTPQSPPFSRVQESPSPVYDPSPLSAPPRTTLSDLPGREELRALIRSVKEVETDQASFVGKAFVINGTIELHSYYNYGYESDVYYSFQVTDHTSEILGASVYMRRDARGAPELRQQLLSAKRNSIKAACLVVITDKRAISSGRIHAELVGCTQPF
ncbi:MAG TPA: caspase family protein [Pyrinomonadaceae bacterium]